MLKIGVKPIDKHKKQFYNLAVLIFGISCLIKEESLKWSGQD